MRLYVWRCNDLTPKKKGPQRQLRAFQNSNQMNREVLSEFATLEPAADSVNNNFLPFFEGVALGVLAGRIRFDVSSGCLEWISKRRSYGVISVNGRQYRAHRLAYQACNGVIPDGLLVCHKCDNPPCFNPSHLFLGTHLDNVQDAARKGRTSRGERHIHAVLTEACARQIKARLAAGEKVIPIAKDFAVSSAVVQSIRAGKTWKWVV
jgi:hypothetical protein